MHSHAPLHHLVYSNSWRSRSPVEKLVLSGGLLLQAAVLPVRPWSLLIFAVAFLAAVCGARIPLRAWLRFLAPQMLFLCAACLPLFFTALPWGWNPAGWERAAEVFLRGLAAASSLALLGLTTPMPDLLLAARTIRVPAVLIEIAFLVYRLITSTYELVERLRLGLRLRLAGRPLRVAAASLSAGNLLVRTVGAARRMERGASLRGIEDFPLLPPRCTASRAFLLSSFALHFGLLSAAFLLRGIFPW